MLPKNKKVVLLHSGGLGSSLLLRQLMAAGNAVTALTVNYGQRAQWEIEAACAVASEVHADFQYVDCAGLGGLFVQASPMVFLISMAMARATEMRADAIGVGCYESVDSLICSLMAAPYMITERPVTLLRPLTSDSAREVCNAGQQIGLSFALTFSCKTGDVHCGDCAGCWRRARGFRESAQTDPTHYNPRRKVTA